MTESVDEATLASFQANKPNYLPIEPQVLSTEVPHEAVQEFSFVEKHSVLLLVSRYFYSSRVR